MHNTASKFQRYLLAGSAGLLIVIGLLLGSSDWIASGSREYVSGTLLKVGVVLGLVWLAAPQLERFGWQKIRGTLLIAVIIVLVLWAIRPRIGAIAAALLVGGSLVFSLVGWFRKLGGTPKR